MTEQLKTKYRHLNIIIMTTLLKWRFLGRSCVIAHFVRPDALGSLKTIKIPTTNN